MRTRSFEHLARRAKLSWSPQATEEHKAAAEFCRAQASQSIYENTNRMEHR